MLNKIAAILILSATALPQEGRPTLARAALAEETLADASQTLDIYRQIANDPQTSPDDRFHASLGIARCLARLGQAEAASAALAALEPEAAGNHARTQLLAEGRARLGHVIQEEDPILKQVIEALRLDNREDFRSRIHALGVRSLPAIRSVMMDRLELFPENLRRTKNAWLTAVLLEINHPDVPAILAEAIGRDALQEARDCLSRVAQYVQPTGDRRFDGVLTAAAADARPAIRRVAASAIAEMPAVPSHVWHSLLTDPDEGVLVDSISLAARALDRIDTDEILDEFDRIVRHPNIRARRALAENLKAIYRLRPNRAIHLASQLIRDPVQDVQIHILAFLPSRADESTEDIWSLALESPHHEVRAMAVDRIGQRMTDAGRQRIIPLLGDPAANVRRRAVHALRATPPGVIASMQGSREIITGLLGDPDSDTRTFSLRMLAHTADESLADRIVPFLHSQDASHRWAAFLYIHRLDLSDYATVVGSKLAALAPERMPWERTTPLGGSHLPVQWLLKTLGDGACRPILAAAEESDRQNSIREWLSAMIQSVSPNAVAEIVAGARGLTSPQTMYTFLYTAGEFLGSAPAARDYYRSLLSHSDASVRETAAQALLRFGTPADADALLDALLDGSPDQEMHTMANALAAHAGPEQIAALRQTWRDSGDIKRRERCLLALSRIAHPEAAGVIVSALREDRPERQALLDFLTATPMEDAYPVILDLVLGGSLTDGEARSAVEILKRFPREESIPALMKAIETHPTLLPQRSPQLAGGESRNLRANFHPSLEAIQAISEERAVATVRSILEGDHPEFVQERAITLLAFIPRNDADRTIVHGLGHPRSNVRAAAARAAGHALVAEAVPALRTMARSSDPGMHLPAEQALLRMIRFGVAAP